MGNCAAGPPKQTKQVAKASGYIKASPKQTVVATDPSLEGLSEQAQVQWKVFSELDTQDEADMIALAGFFQTLSESTLVKAVDMGNDMSEAVSSITFDDVGRVGTSRQKLNEYHIDPKEKVTLEIAVDIIECFRRGGKLHALTVHKLLKDTYWMLKQFPNIRHARTTGAHQSVTVVGDLHGQLTDLLYILDATGPPSESNTIIVNGDFVDRGSASLPVTLILFALQLAAPEHVFLNRGNHEEASICYIFGFFKECLAAYDEVTFSMFVEVFRYLPLATIIDSQVIVLHGGLFSKPGVLLEDLMAADRKVYSLDKANTSSPKQSRRTNDEAKRQQFLNQLVKEMLWSDPEPIEGRRPNPRGEGVIFGAEATMEFLSTNGLRMVVRSHECVRWGFDQPFGGEGKELLCTIFSASHYAGSANHGAFMTFTTSAEAKGSKEVRSLEDLPKKKSTWAGATTAHKLFYAVHTYGGDLHEQEQHLRNVTQASLANLILKKKLSLRRAFEAEDAAKTGTVSVDVLARVMEQVTKIHVQWLLLLPLLLPGRTDGAMTDVDYTELLEGFQLQFEGADTAGKEHNRALFDALYVNRRELEAMFAFFDKDKNGSISRAEFREGCEALNAHLPAESRLAGLDRLMDLLDFDRSGTIEVAEFFEGFRLMDLRDGKQDGKIDVRTKPAAATA